MEAITKKPSTGKTPVKKPATHPHVAKKPTAHAPVVKKPAHAPHPVAAKAEAEVAVVETEVVEKPAKVHPGKSYYAVGRRKTSVTQVLLTHGNGTITANLLPLEKYFQTEDLMHIALQPLKTVGMDKTINIKAKLSGGGIHSQAESFRHAVARALIALNPESRRTLKKLGFLKRDPRVKERKKPGLKRARRAPQFSKR